MSILTGRRSNTVKLSRTAIDQIDVFLNNLPDKSKELRLLHEALDYLQECVQAALAKGYSYADLETELRKKGFTISLSTFKNDAASNKSADVTNNSHTRNTRSRHANSSRRNGALAEKTASSHPELITKMAGSNFSQPAFRVEATPDQRPKTGVASAKSPSRKR